MKKSLAIILLLAIVGGSYAYYLFNKPVQSLASSKADVTISARELLADYEANEQEANDQYLNKVLEVTGTIREVQKENEQLNIVLDTDSPLGGIVCEMEKASLEKLKSGQQISIKGNCTGYLMDVVLTKCVLIK